MFYCGKIHQKKRGNFLLWPLTRSRYSLILKLIVFISLRDFFSFHSETFMGKGQNYENHNVQNQKEHWKIWRWSLHWNVSFSWSLLRHQYYDKKKTFDVVILPMASKKITTSISFLSNYLWHITYGYQGLWGPGGFG